MSQEAVENPISMLRDRGARSRVTSKTPDAVGEIDTFGDDELIEVPIDEILPFAKNPRKARNPKFEEIKESVRKDGLLHPPNITRPNKNSPWTIADGGNTRLEVVTALRDEAHKAGDIVEEERFSKMVCRPRNWKGEAKVLGYHVTENDLRGDMLFIDKAIAYDSIMTLTMGPNWRDLGLNQTAKAGAVCGSGWNVRPDMISRFENFLKYKEVLSSYLSREPTPDRAGVGRNEFQWVLDLSKSYQALITKRDAMDLPPNPAEVIEEKFRDVLRKHDSAELNTIENRAALRKDMNAALHVLLGIDQEEIEATLQTIRAEKSVGLDDDSEAVVIENDTASNPTANTKNKPRKKRKSTLIAEFSDAYAEIVIALKVDHATHEESGIPYLAEPCTPIKADVRPLKAMLLMGLYLQPIIATANMVSKPPQSFDIEKCFISDFSSAWLAAESYRAEIKSGKTSPEDKARLKLLINLEKAALNIRALGKTVNGGSKP